MKTDLVTIDTSQVISNDPHMAQVVRNLNILLPRIEAIGRRWGANPCRTLFTLKSDKQVMDDMVYPVCIPVSRPAWWYGKATVQIRRNANGGHVFEFATVANPAHVVLGYTNDLVMQIEVINHAWFGHVHIFTNSVWHAHCEHESVLQRFAQDEAFVKALVADTARWGWDRYEYYADACHALEHYSGEVPVNVDSMSDDEHREMLRNQLEVLKNDYVLAKSEQDREAIATDMQQIDKQLACHPIVPTGDILDFVSHEANVPGVPEEARYIAKMTRFEDRYGTQTIGRIKTLHEGLSHFFDSRLLNEPELDLIRLGVDKLIDAARYHTMHDAWPIYWYSDPYALGELLVTYVWEKTRIDKGDTDVTFRRLSMDEAGDIHETDEIVTRQVKNWDNSKFFEVMDTYNDYRLFDTYLTEEFFARLHKQALDWVKKMFMMINKRLKDLGWDNSLVFEGDEFPETLEDMMRVIMIWMNQLQMAQWLGGGGWFGYGAPSFPASQIVLWQMQQIVQRVAAYDADKHEFKRQMLLRTELLALPNIKVVDSGRYNNAGRWTLRHEYDTDFGPLRQSYARETLRKLWRYSGPVRLLTSEILYDVWGRPWGPPRPYQYFTANGVTVKERWL